MTQLEQSLQQTFETIALATKFQSALKIAMDTLTFIAFSSDKASATKAQEAMSKMKEELL